MDSPGIDIRPLREMTGRAMFNEVFLDEVFVPDDCVLGAPGDGWRIARSTLATERVAMGRGSALGDEVEDLLAQVRARGAGPPTRRHGAGSAALSRRAGWPGRCWTCRADRLAAAGAGAEPGASWPRCASWSAWRTGRRSPRPR